MEVATASIRKTPLPLSDFHRDPDQLVGEHPKVAEGCGLCRDLCVTCCGPKRTRRIIGYSKIPM